MNRDEDFIPDAHNDFSLEYLLQELSMDEEEEGEEWDEEMYLVMCARWKKERLFKWDHERIDWDSYVAKKLHNGGFNRAYRMSFDAFYHLLELLRPMITYDVIKSKNSCDKPIFPELVLATGIRWLAGGSYIDIMDVYDYSQSSFYRCRNTFLTAVLTCDALEIKFPETPEELEAVRVRFEAKSSEGVMRGCVGALDGLLARIKCPSVAESNGNPRAYHSGHYNATGLNVQAICDSRLRFLCFAVAKPGGSSDLFAYESLSIREIIENLPDGIYIVADAAYMLTEHVLVPFTGGDRYDANKDTYNYFLSQLRIRIEMAFGLLTTKWSILQTNLANDLVLNSQVVMACARLHNFVIDQDWEDDFDEDCHNGDDLTSACRIAPMEGSPLGWGYLPTVEQLETIPGTSRTRDAILQHVAQNGLRRPAANVERRRQELHEMEPPLM